LGDDRITIVQEKKHGGHNKFELNGLLVPDPEFGALDMMYAMRIYLDTPLSDLRVLDSEGDDFLYWRNVSVFRPKELARLCRGDSAHVERFFGRLSPSERWIDGEPVTISEKPFINPPLRNTLGPLFGKVFPDEGGVLPFAYNQSRAITYRLEE
jgi:hypothetical protein